VAVRVQMLTTVALLRGRITAKKMRMTMKTKRSRYQDPLPFGRSSLTVYLLSHSAAQLAPPRTPSWSPGFLLPASVRALPSPGA
jgi:hypothetical protein